MVKTTEYCSRCGRKLDGEPFIEIGKCRICYILLPEAQTERAAKIRRNAGKPPKSSRLRRGTNKAKQKKLF